MIAPDPAIKIVIDDKKWKGAFPKMEALLKKAALASFAAAKKNIQLAHLPLVITIVLTSDRKIAKLNGDWRHKPKPTNVLSFPMIDARKFNIKKLPPLPPRSLRPLGDIYIAQGVVKKEAKAEGKTVEAHTMHLVCHGVLHLLGYDHMKSREAKIMENLERRILAGLGYPDPYSIPYLRVVKE